MPTYVYRRADGTRFEHQQRITEDALTECPTTGQAVTRVPSASAGLVFKGAGFYQTDYVRPSGDASAKGASEGGETKPEGGASSGGSTSDGGAGAGSGSGGGTSGGSTSTGGGSAGASTPGTPGGT